MIRLDGLNKEHMEKWRTKANSFEGDSISSFICCWIAFNYYYSTFASVNNENFEDWVTKKRSGHKGDRSEWLFLIRDEKFAKLFDSFKEKLPSLLINLPIKDELNGREVPEGIAGERDLKDLGTEHIFSVLYQIRNNLFHGRKDPSKNKRDNALCTIGAKFFDPFISELLSNTK